MMDTKKLFWAIAVVVAIASVAAGVAYFVSRQLSKQDEECDELFDFDDFDELDEPDEDEEDKEDGAKAEEDAPAAEEE